MWREIKGKYGGKLRESMEKKLKENMWREIEGRIWGEKARKSCK